MGKLGKSVSYILLSLGVMVTMFPIIWIVVFAFLPENAVKKYPPQLIPDSLYLDNFHYVIERTNIIRGMTNSLVVVVFACLMVVMLSSIGAYGAARSSSKIRSGVLILLFVTQMVPAVTNMIPIYYILNLLHLRNTLPGLSIIYAAQQLPLAMIILIGFYKNALIEMEEAAMIDGCNWWSVFTRVSLPMSRLGLVSAVIFTFALSWNEFMLAMVLNSKPAIKTFQVTLYDLLMTESQYRLRYNVLTAAALMGLIPILIVYAVFQRGFTEGLAQGSIK